MVMCIECDVIKRDQSKMKKKIIVSPLSGHGHQDLGIMFMVSVPQEHLRE